MSEKTETQALLSNTEMPLDIDSTLCHSVDPKDQELQDLREQLARSQARLSYLSEAQRLLAAQIRQADLSAHPIKKLGDDQTIATDCDTVLSEEEGTNNHHTNATTSSNRARAWSAASVDPTEYRLCQITEELTQSQTADLLALQNAAHMLQEHARLSSQEAVEAVQDAVHAQRSMEEWKRRALRAERKCMDLHTENVTVKAQNEKLAAERRVLIKEVRKMRKAQTEKQNYWQHFESYIMGAMNMHEQQLRKTASKDTTDDSCAYSSDEGARVTLKTNKPIHVESEQVPRAPPAAPKCNPDDDEDDDCAFVPVPSNNSSQPHLDNRPLKKISSFGGGLANGLGNCNRVMRRQVQRTLGKAPGETRDGRSSPPDRIDVYPGECVSPVMSYDSVVDDVWCVDSNHSKSTLGDGDLDKECSGCASAHGSS